MYFSCTLHSIISVSSLLPVLGTWARRTSLMGPLQPTLHANWQNRNRQCCYIMILIIINADCLQIKPAKIYTSNK